MIIMVYVCIFQSPMPFLIFLHIIDDLPVLCLRLPEFNSVYLLSDMSSMIIVVHACVFQDKFRVLNVRHITYDHYLWLSLPEIHTMVLMFDISSMVIVLHVCVFQ